MSIDIKKLKQQLTIKDYEQIINALNIPIISKSDNLYSLATGCHHKDTNGVSSNLKFKLDTKTFTCYTDHCFSGDIIALVQKRNQLFDKDFSFIDAINFILDNSSIDIEHVIRKTPKKSNSLDWDKFFGRYIRNESIYTDLEIYDDEILKKFPNIYHQSWIDDNITISTMDKFDIRYYSRNQQIIVPVRDENMNLVGIHGRNLNPVKIDMGLKYQPVKLLDGTEYKFPTSAVLYGLAQNKENIVKTKSVRIFEGFKSVLQMESIIEHNNSVALFGLNMTKYKRKLLLDLGVNKAEICIDKQYHKCYDENNSDKENEEFLAWKRIVDKMVNMLKAYMDVDVVYDYEGLLGFTNSPSDKGKDIWEQLWKMRWRLN